MYITAYSQSIFVSITSSVTYHNDAVTLFCCLLHMFMFLQNPAFCWIVDTDNMS